MYNLNLLNVESTEEIHQRLIKMKDVNKIKITGLHDEAKFNSFIEELSKLNNATFNIIQCDCSGNQLTDDQFQQMNNALLSKMNQLKSLNLEDNNIEAAGAVAIANSSHMSNLSSLNLEKNNIKDMGVLAIAQSENMKQITSLSLAKNNIEAEGARVIAINLTNLTSLNLGGNNIGDEGAVAIAQSENMKQITSLNLEGNNIKTLGAVAIAQFENMKQITSLNLGKTKSKLMVPLPLLDLRI